MRPLCSASVFCWSDTVVSQAWAPRRLPSVACTGVYLVLAYTPFAMVGIAAVPLLFARVGINPAVSGDAAVYLHILNLGALPLLVYARFVALSRRRDRVRPVTFTVVSAT